jgi:DNA-binding transcriptional LysR family regulator
MKVIVYHGGMKRIHDINLNLLAVLEAILRLGSVTAAAQHLHISQSAVSHALRKLRVLFKDPLFVQQGNKLEPTSLATDLHPRLQRLMTDAESLVFEPTRFEPATDARDFHIVALDFLDLLLLPRIYALLSKGSPASNLRVHRPTGSGMLDILEEHPSYVSIGVGMPAAHDILEKVLWSENFLLASSQDHPLAQKTKLTLDDFIQHKHALISTGGQDKAVVDEFLAKIGKARRTAVVVPSFLSIPMLVAQSDLIVTAPRQGLLALRQQLPIRLYEPPLKLPGFTMKLYWHRRFDRDPAQMFLRKLILDSTQTFKNQPSVI